MTDPCILPSEVAAREAAAAQAMQERAANASEEQHEHARRANAIRALLAERAMPDREPLSAAAIAVLASCEDGLAIVRDDPDRAERWERWPEMEALAVALDAAAPGWRALALREPGDGR